MIGSPPERVLQRLASEGLVTLATEPLDEVIERLVLPLEIAADRQSPDRQSPSERLAKLRRDER